MILTRRDYRFHYRVNNEPFDSVRDMLQTKHTLFLGFGHKDPEVTRLVDDAIHKYEKDLDPKEPPEHRPQFYSLQSDMKEHTPEVFAARGIVALNPPSVITEGDDIRTLALGISLADLLAAKQHNLHAKESLDSHLNEAVNLPKHASSQVHSPDPSRERGEVAKALLPVLLAGQLVPADPTIQRDDDPIALLPKPIKPICVVGVFFEDLRQRNDLICPQIPRRTRIRRSRPARLCRSLFSRNVSAPQERWWARS